MLTLEKVALINELKMLEVVLLAMNKELEKKLAIARGQKICLICEKPTIDDDICDVCYRREWKDIRLDEGR